MHIVNNQETHENDTVFYVDKDKQVYEAVVKSIIERDGNHYAELSFERDGKRKRAKDVPHNTSPEKHSWNHPLSDKERKTHYHPDFYGPAPEVTLEQESQQEPPEEKDYSALELDDETEENETNA